MLSYDLRELERHALPVDGALAADDPIWEEADARPAGGIHATGRLSTAGSGRYYWSGQIEGEAESPCRRCLAPARTRVRESVHLIFTEGDAEAEDADMYRLPPHAAAIDLRPAVREQWLLAVPAYVLCREECAGFCPHCGADLNLTSCDCASAPDSRWDALRALRDASH